MIASSIIATGLVLGVIATRFEAGTRAFILAAAATAIAIGGLFISDPVTGAGTKLATKPDGGW